MTPTAPAPETDEPVYWFCILEQARWRGDFDLAARAKRELERLGVRISYRRKRPMRGVSHAG
jgi:hypothetical protein